MIAFAFTLDLVILAQLETKKLEQHLSLKIFKYTSSLCADCFQSLSRKRKFLYQRERPSKSELLVLPFCPLANYCLLLHTFEITTSVLAGL
jgi:hypothetical protein